MKIIGFILVVSVVYTHAVDDEALLKKWKEFQIDFGKSYRSPVEARRRLNIFKQNLEKIDSHNALYEKGLVTYEKGINQFTDLTYEEFEQFLSRGLKEIPKPTSKPFKAIEGENVPDSIDWREKGAVNPIRDQGNCASYWAFSAVAAIEGALAISTGKLQSLSEQNLVDCSWAQRNMGCDGGWMHQAFDYVKEYGIESEDDYPYEATDVNWCRVNSSTIFTKIRDYVQVEAGNEDELKKAIARGPVSVAYTTTPNFQAYKSGILVDDLCYYYRTVYGVVAVGYGTENGIDYYILRNCLGTAWGESGYFRLARNQGNMCAIATLAHYPEI